MKKTHGAQGMRGEQRRIKFGIMNNPWIDIEASFIFARKMGLSFIDFTVEHPVPRRESINPKLIKRLSKKYGMGLVGHTNYRVPIGHEVEGVRKAAALEIIKTADLFRKIGIKKVNVHCDDSSKTSLGEEFIRKQHVKSLKEIIRHTKKNRQILMLENGFPFYRWAQIKTILKKVPGLKLHLDIGHANLGGRKEIGNFIIKGRKYIEHIHIHDNMGSDDDHMFLGMGSIDWRKVFRLLRKTGYNKTATLETFVVKKGRTLQRATPREMERYFRKEMLLLKKLV